MRAISLAGAVLATFVAAAAHAGADLVLIDGGVLKGEAVERTKDGLYLLTTADGSVLTVPVSVVKALRLTGGEDPAPTGMLVTGPRTVAGPDDPIPQDSPAEQVAAFGRPPARFAQATIDPNYRMVSALGPDVSDFNPARWYKTARSFEWTPTPAYRASQDRTQFNPVRWYKSPTDPTWRPTSGFR
jgi:hypothetical protein